jgi:hypothetical protein
MSYICVECMKDLEPEKVCDCNNECGCTFCEECIEEHNCDDHYTPPDCE